MDALDNAILRFVNQFAFKSKFFDNVVIAVHESYLVHLALVAMLWWIWVRANGTSSQRDREIAVSTTLASLISLCIGRLLAHWLPFRLRPAVDPAIGLPFPDAQTTLHTLRTWSAFPSDHAMMWFAVATGILLVSRRLGLVAIIYSAILICMPRLYLGLHHPTDILAGAALGIATSLVMNSQPLRRHVAAPIVVWSTRHEAAFYVGLLFLSFELASEFDELRALSGTFLKHL